MLTQSTFSGYETINNGSIINSSTNELSLNGIKLRLSMDSLKKSDNNLNNSFSLDSSKQSLVKKERLSPKTNGHNNNLRSGDVTPSSTSPLNEVENRNTKNRGLPSDALDGGSSGEFSSRNYSDFMRSLAAKYNNNNDFTDNRLSTFNCEIPSSAKNISSKTFPVTSDTNKQINKSLVSNVSPLVTSLLSSLQFSSTNAFPPLIDMSSTQALVTLARASKEVEIQNYLRTAHKRRRTSTSPTDLQPPQKLNSSSHDSLISTFLLPSQSSQEQHSIVTATALSKAKKLVNIENSASGNTTTPLDLSSAPVKRIRLDDETNTVDINLIEENKSKKARTTPIEENRKCINVDLKSELNFQCQIDNKEINSWTVDEVCEFVGNINICAEYVEKFREHRIDGYGLPLLTENHMVNTLGMKLGPALKLRTMLAKKLGGPCPCTSCTTKHNLIASTINPYVNINHNLSSSDTEHNS